MEVLLMERLRPGRRVILCGYECSCVVVGVHECSVCSEIFSLRLRSPRSDLDWDRAEHGDRQFAKVIAAATSVVCSSKRGKPTR